MFKTISNVFCKKELLTIPNSNIRFTHITDSWPTTPQKVIVPGSVTSASVQNLQPATSYHLRIIAENRLGQSEPSQLIQVTTTEESKTSLQSFLSESH